MLWLLILCCVLLLPYRGHSSFLCSRAVSSMQARPDSLLLFQSPALLIPVVLSPHVCWCHVEGATEHISSLLPFHSEFELESASGTCPGFHSEYHSCAGHLNLVPKHIANEYPLLSCHIHHDLRHAQSSCDIRYEILGMFLRHSPAQTQSEKERGWRCALCPLDMRPTHMRGQHHRDEQGRATEEKERIWPGLHGTHSTAAEEGRVSTVGQQQDTAQDREP
ncbi:hypothetical protein P7K49_007955 [Saguinus oedipus]|uniref:Secreted protein n=1 Tax=Saguinus oedipus TaxID=9490 RepID=A0ABQ9VWB6_SAGOE|nr:hypothetical protein P7K49_007955 [Saguinus oedipus]